MTTLFATLDNMILTMMSLTEMKTLKETNYLKQKMYWCNNCSENNAKSIYGNVATDVFSAGAQVDAYLEVLKQIYNKKLKTEQWEK